MLIISKSPVSVSVVGDAVWTMVYPPMLFFARKNDCGVSTRASFPSALTPRYLPECPLLAKVT